MRVNKNIDISKGNNNSVSLINKSMNEKSDFETFEKVICESDLSDLELSQLNILQVGKVYSALEDGIFWPTYDRSRNPL